MANKKTIGWIGLGKMGIPMSKNLIKAGYPLTVFNRTRGKARELADQGAQVVDSPREPITGSTISRKKPLSGGLGA